MSATIQQLGMSLARWYLRAPTPEIGKWRLRAWLLRAMRRHTTERETTIVTTRSGSRMELNLADYVDQHIYVHGVYEPVITRLAESILRPGDRFVDLGANIGYFTVLASRLVGPGGRVVAFEPVPAVRERLVRNLELNDCKNVELHAEAASDSTGTAQIHVGPAAHSGISSLRTLDESAAALSVPTIRLEEVPALQAPPRLVKIDVEGAELRVVRGLGRLWESWGNSFPDFLVEFSQSYLRGLGDSAEELFAEFQQRGYRHYQIEWDRLIPVESWHAKLPDQYNAFLTKGSVPTALAELLQRGGRA
jgi:FkbM family methyltransferase